MAKEAKYVVELTSQERSLIKQILSKGKAAAYKQRHGRIDSQIETQSSLIHFSDRLSAEWSI